MWPDKYEDKRQGRQWHSDTQDPRAGAERLEAQDTATQTAGGGLHRHHHTWHLYCNMQTPDITTLHHIHNTVFRFSINLVTRKSVTCSMVWSWGCLILSWCFEVEINYFYHRVKITGECIFSWYICGPSQHKQWTCEHTNYGGRKVKMNIDTCNYPRLHYIYVTKLYDVCTVINVHWVFYIAYCISGTMFCLIFIIDDICGAEHQIINAPSSLSPKSIQLQRIIVKMWQGQCQVLRP